jgi:hypothetical protein
MGYSRVLELIWLRKRQRELFEDTLPVPIFSARVFSVDLLAKKLLSPVLRNTAR